MDKNYGYRHTKGFVIILLIFIIGCISVAYGQVVSGSPNTPSGYSIDSTTGNLVQNPTMTSGTGWTTSGMTGSYTPDGYIFSYASGTIQQDVNFGAINFGYQNTGAVFATGIAYGFKYRFQCAQTVGTSCDTGTTQDTLNATFTYRAPNGTVEATNVYQLGLKNVNDGNPAYNPVWQQLAETYTFAGAKPIATVGTARLSITGMDGGFWACNPDCYGPQIKDAYMRLNYSVDPCVLNPAFNSNCPGFQNILQGSKSPTFYYSYNIAQSLPHIGGGVVLHGYDYGFNWYNYGACYNTFMFWCTDWRTDGGGNINFRVSDKNNVTMLQQQWYVAGNNNAGSFSSRHLFTESKNSLDMGSVQWWASDVWNHFGWVGWTRPIWTPDPCYSNGLYSPNCSNFQSTLTQVIADVKEQQERIAALTPVATSSSTPAPGGEITVTIGNATGATPSVAVNTAVNTNTGSEQSGTSSNTQFALSLVQGNQRREQTIAIQASQTARSEAAARAESARSEAVAIADANQQQGAAASDAAAEAAQASGTVAVPGRVGTQSAQMSLGSAAVSAASMTAGTMLPLPGATRQTATVLETIMPNEPANTGSTLAVRMPEPQPSSVQQVTTAVSVTPPYQAPQAMDTVQLPKQEPIAVAATQVDLAMVDNRLSITAMFRPTTPAVDTASLPPAAPVTETPAVIQTTPVATIETRTIETDSATSPTNFVTNRTNPITSIVEGRAPTVDSGPPKTELAAVNKTVAPNELAAGMDIDRIAITPQGFNVYASLVLRDAAFYAPREIYRGQRTVDNVRALRSLGQDARHQEMVDQQYRR